MPSGKHRDFDDTWKHDELEKSLKGTRDDKKKSRDRDRDKSRKREDEDRHRKRREDDDRRERKHRDKENGEVDRKDRHKSNRHEEIIEDLNEDRERSHRRHREDRDHGEDRKNRKPREEEDDRERRHRKHREENAEDREKRHRRPKEGEDEDRERRHRKHRDEDEDRERRHRRHKEHDNEDENDEDRERRHRRHRDKEHGDDDERRSKRRDEDEEERRKRKERERRHREENGEKPRKHREEEEGRRRDRKDDDRNNRRRDEDEDERRRRHEEKKRQREREKEEQRDREREEENRKQREREKQREAEAKKRQKPSEKKPKPASRSLHDLSLKSSSSGMTKDYIEYLEETYLVEDDFEADSHASSETKDDQTPSCLARGDNNGDNADHSATSEENEELKAVGSGSSPTAEAVVVPTCAHLNDLVMNDEFTGYSKYERFPCPTPAPHNSHTSIEGGRSCGSQPSVTDLPGSTSDAGIWPSENDKQGVFILRASNSNKGSDLANGSSSTSTSSVTSERLEKLKGVEAGVADNKENSIHSLKDDLFAALEKAVSLSSHYGQATKSQCNSESSSLLLVNSRKLQDITQDLASKGTSMVMKEGGGSRPDLDQIRQSLDELEKDLKASANIGECFQGQEDFQESETEEEEIIVDETSGKGNRNERNQNQLGQNFIKDDVSDDVENVENGKDKNRGRVIREKELRSNLLKEQTKAGPSSHGTKITKLSVTKDRAKLATYGEGRPERKSPRDAYQEKVLNKSGSSSKPSPQRGIPGIEKKQTGPVKRKEEASRTIQNKLQTKSPGGSNQTQEIVRTSPRNSAGKPIGVGNVSSSSQPARNVRSPRSSPRDQTAERSKGQGSQIKGASSVGRKTMDGRASSGSSNKSAGRNEGGSMVSQASGRVGSSGSQTPRKTGIDSARGIGRGTYAATYKGVSKSPRDAVAIARGRESKNADSFIGPRTPRTNIKNGPLSPRRKPFDSGTTGLSLPRENRAVRPIRGGILNETRKKTKEGSSGTGGVSRNNATRNNTEKNVQKTLQISYVEALRDGAPRGSVSIRTGGGGRGGVGGSHRGGFSGSSSDSISAPMDQLDMNNRGGGGTWAGLTQTDSNISLETQYSHGNSWSGDEEEGEERIEEVESVQKTEEAEDDYGDYEDDFEDYDDDFEDDDEDNGENNEEQSPTKKDVAGSEDDEESHSNGYFMSLDSDRNKANGVDGSDSEPEDVHYSASVTKDQNKANDVNRSNSEGEEVAHSKGYYMSLNWDPSKASRSEVDEIKQAMDEENKRLSLNAQRNSQQAARKYDEDSDEDQAANDSSYRRGNRPAQRSFINFVSAKQRQITGVASSKARRRGNELSKLIELDFAKFELFDMPPVSEYDLYMRSFGSTGTRQAYVQTSEDNIEREIQTEEIETRELYTQHPPEQSDAVGGPDFEKKSEEYRVVDSLRLGRFIQRAGTLILNILEEDATERAQGALAESRQRSSICLSEAFTELKSDHLTLLKDRHVIHSHFSPIQTNLLLTVYSPKTQVTSGDQHSNKGVVCVWNVHEPDQPQKVLVCESRPRCCCFSPIRATLAFAGMHDGSLSVWDLREFSSQHQTYRDCDTELVLRYPTYSTAGILQYENHQSAVVSITPIVTPGDSASASLGEGGEGQGMSFQVATLEENSVIHLWVVAEISQPDPAGSEFDLGLSPGGRIKVIRSSTIQLESPLRDARLRTTMTAFDMQLLPSNNSHFYVATDTGCVIHGVRYGGKAPPRTYIGETDSPVRVTSIDFSPFPESVFLAGCDDGTLRLHHTDGEYPFIVWPNATGGAPITCVRWSRSRPSVFFVLDGQARLHIWDLMMSDAVPMKYEQIAEERVTSFEMSNDYNATGRGQPEKKPQMVVSLASGSTEVHTLSREFSALMPDEVDQFSQLIQRIT